jgi:uncharacterized protein YdhG (YjbR/CyaY superfamily)
MKREQTARSVDACLKQRPPHVREILTELRATIRAAAPQASEKIGYGMPTFYLKGNLVHFAAYDKHIGFYPTASAITAFAKDLRAYPYLERHRAIPARHPVTVETDRETGEVSCG